MALTNALNIANFFIEKAFEYGDEIEPMKLLKLVYISHGWHLGLTKKPLISESAQAWKYGPVVQSVYREFKYFGKNNINQMCERDGKILTVDDEDTKKFLTHIYSMYKDYSGLDLSILTHKEGTPWYQVWHSMGSNKVMEKPIPNQLIEDFYKAKINENLVGC